MFIVYCLLFNVYCLLFNCHSVVIHCHSVVIHCHTLSFSCHSLSYIVIHCHSLSYIVIHCHSVVIQLSFIVIHCHSIVYCLKKRYFANHSTWQKELVHCLLLTAYCLLPTAYCQLFYCISIYFCYLILFKKVFSLEFMVLKTWNLKLQTIFYVYCLLFIV